jgi:hypothetical protein
MRVGAPQQSSGLVAAHHVDRPAVPERVASLQKQRLQRPLGKFTRHYLGGHGQTTSQGKANLRNHYRLRMRNLRFRMTGSSRLRTENSGSSIGAPRIFSSRSFRMIGAKRLVSVAERLKRHANASRTVTSFPPIFDGSEPPILCNVQMRRPEGAVRTRTLAIPRNLPRLVNPLEPQFQRLRR